MKILQVAFLLLFNYLDSLPKLYEGHTLCGQLFVEIGVPMNSYVLLYILYCHS